MLLKRHYARPEGWVKKVNAEGDCINPPPLSHVEVCHTGTHAEQHFSENLVKAGIAEGWVTLSRGKLIIHGKPEDLNYDIRRVPGHYCLHCKMALPNAASVNGEGKTGGQLHVAAEHKGAKSPDPSNPWGYERINYYDCVLDAKQQAAHSFKRKVVVAAVKKEA